MDQQDASHTITPSNSPARRPQRSLGARLRGLRRALTTKKGLVGDYDYVYLFRPNLPLMRRRGGPRSRSRAAPFFGLHDRMPVLLAVLLGLQHALAMLAGVITPPLIISGPAGANLDVADQQYLVSTALIVSGILSAVQITRFRLFRSSYYIGSGVLSVVGISFNLIPVALGGFQQMYASGYCPTTPSGTRLPCPRGYGALVGTAALCSLLEMLIGLVPPRLLLRLCPPIVTGPTVMLIGVKLIESGLRSWMGGAGPCADPATATGLFAACPTTAAPRPLPWGSPEFFGLGLAVFVSVLLCERFGAPLMRSAAVVLGLLVGCVVAAATGYFDGAPVAAAPVASFIWVRTFPLSLHGPLVLPVLAVYAVCAVESVGDITATCDVSRLPVRGRSYESRVRGGILADGLNGLLACLMTLTPVSTFSQNNGVIALTRCASRRAGYVCCALLVLAGVFAKLAAAIVAIPASVVGGMTTFLFTAVAVSGIAIIARGVPFTRRSRFVLTAGLALGYGATLVPTYFARVLAYAGDNRSLRAFLDAITLIMQTGFAVTAAVCMVLNLALPEEDDEEEEVVEREEEEEDKEDVAPAATMVDDVDAHARDAEQTTTTSGSEAKFVARDAEVSK